MNAGKPFTLTLSHWEREQPLHDLVEIGNREAEYSQWFAEELGAFPPLPKGEGRGEGKQYYSSSDYFLRWPTISFMLPRR